MTADQPRLHLRVVPGADADAQPVVFFHGAWHASWVWAEWLPRFAAAGFYPVAPDLRGHGESAGSWKKARLADYVTEARDLANRLDREPVLVGHSLGGLIIQHLVTERVFPAAVLIAPIPGRYPPHVIARFALRHPLVMARANLSRDLKALVATPELVRETLFGPETPEETIRACHERLTGASPVLFREMVQRPPGGPRPGTPTAIVAPAADASFMPAMQRALARKLGAEVFEIERAGHDVLLEPTATKVIDLIVSWLRSAEKANGRALMEVDG